MAVKMIKVGMRECIMTEKHCIPFDVVARIEWFPEPLGNMHPEVGAKIYTATVQEGLFIPEEEAKALKKVLSIG